jgi:ribosomal protein S3
MVLIGIKVWICRGEILGKEFIRLINLGVFFMLMPKRVKFRKSQRGRMKGKAYRGSALLRLEILD